MPVLVLVVVIVGGSALAALGGAGRTGSAMSRMLAYSRLDTDSVDVSAVVPSP